MQQQGTLPNDFGSSVTALINIVATIMDDEVGPAGLNALDFSILRFCLGLGGCSAKDITEALPIDASRVSRCVDKMVNMDFLRRRRLRTDRRVVRLELTAKGKTTTLELIGNVEARQASVLKDVSRREFDGFIATSQKVTAAFAAEEAARPPRGPRPAY